MFITSLYWLLVATSLAVAIRFGGRDGKWAVGIVVGASVTTIPATRLASWNSTQWPVTLVDTLTFVAFYSLSLRSNRYWPLWLAAFQLLTVLTHAATALGQAFAPDIYRSAETLWSLPILITLVLGPMADHGQRPRL